MNRSRNLVKRVIYRVFGNTLYQRAYVRGKLSDIRNEKHLEPEASLLGHFVQAGNTVLDVGANYGHYSILLSRLVKTGTVHAFEPVPFTFSVLKEIVHKMGAANVKLTNAAVSSTQGTAHITLPLLEFGAPNTGVAHIGSNYKGRSVMVEVNTIQIDALNLDKVSFIKMDIEGHEPEAIQGMEKVLQQSQPIILIEFSHACLQRANHSPQEFSSTLRLKFGYEFYAKLDQKLQKINDDCPRDGYYFLIPKSKIQLYPHLVVS